MNPYTGDAPLEMGGRVLTLRYDWAAISRIRAEMGVEGQVAALKGDLNRLSELVAIGLAVHHPDVDAAAVFLASPPVNPTVRAVDVALSAAWSGPGANDQEERGNPQRPPGTLLSGLSRRLFGRGSARKNSGV